MSTVVITGAAILEELAKKFSTIANGELGNNIRSLLCAGSLVPVNKKDNGIRPVVLAQTILNIAAKLLLQHLQATVDTLPLLPQLGVGRQSHGLQAAILTAQSWAANMENKILLKLDISNAFNSINRRVILDNVAIFLPDALPMTTWCLNGPSTVWWKSKSISCTTGVQQGNPLSPLLFDLGLVQMVEAVSTLNQILHLWWHDDGLLYGEPEKVGTTFALIKQKLSECGLQLNTSKCEIYSLNQITVPPTLSGIPVIYDRTLWTYLGAPLVYETVSVFETTGKKSELLLKAIGAISDSLPLHALNLLRSCAGACRFEHLLNLPYR